MERLELRPLLTANEVAKKLGIHPDTLESWRKTSKGPMWVKVGNKVYYRPEQVESYQREVGKRVPKY